MNYCNRQRYAIPFIKLSCTTFISQIQKKYASAHSAAIGEDDAAMRTAIKKASSLGKRAHTEMLYMSDKNTSMTDLVEQRPSTNL